MKNNNFKININFIYFILFFHFMQYQLSIYAIDRKKDIIAIRNEIYFYFYNFKSNRIFYRILSVYDTQTCNSLIRK